MIRPGVILILCLAIVAGCRDAGNRSVAPIRVSQQPELPATLDELDWLAGYWTGDDAGTRMEEVWLPRRGEMMLGMHVDLFPSGRTFFEYLRIEQEGNSVVFLASPRGRTATAFIATSVRDSTVTFENSQHDYPQNIEYTLGRDGRLNVRISGDVNGSEESTEWVWYRSELPR